LAEGTNPLTVTVTSPWFVKILLGFSGWLAAAFLFGFIAVTFYFIMESEALSFVCGSLIIFGSYHLLLKSRNEFFEHLALAISLSGQGLIINSLSDPGHSAWFIIALMHTGLALVMPNFLHRFFSALFAALSLFMATYPDGVLHISSGLVMFLCVWLWLHEFSYSSHIRKIQAIAYGLTIALIIQKGTLLFANHGLDFLFSQQQPLLWAQPWVGDLFHGGAMFYLVGQILKSTGRRLNEPLGILCFIATAAITLLSIETQGLTLGLMLLLLGFVASNRVLQGIGIISLLFYISTYYYLLQTSLLVKSQTLLIVGLTLLVTRFLFLRLLAQVTRDE